MTALSNCFFRASLFQPATDLEFLSIATASLFLSALWAKMRSRIHSGTAFGADFQNNWLMQGGAAEVAVV
jgi:hypothetical protein